MSIVIQHDANPLLQTMTAYFAAKQLEDKRAKEIDAQREFETKKAYADAGIGAFSDIASSYLNSKAAQRRHQSSLELLQERSRLDQEAGTQLQVDQREQEWELYKQKKEADGYAYEYSAAAQGELNKIDTEEQRVHNQRQTMSPESYIDAVQQLDERRNGIPKTFVFKGEKPPTPQQLWNSGEAGFEKDGIYFIRDPKTGKLDPFQPKSAGGNNDPEMRIKAFNASWKNLQEKGLTGTTNPSFEQAAMLAEQALMFANSGGPEEGGGLDPQTAKAIQQASGMPMVPQGGMPMTEPTGPMRPIPVIPDASQTPISKSDMRLQIKDRVKQLKSKGSFANLTPEEKAELIQILKLLEGE